MIAYNEVIVDLRRRLMDIKQIFIRLWLATIVGGLIGMERERYNRPAGLRTHILVTVGSTLIMLVSISGFDSLGRQGDPARMAAQVVSGIGFLGAGTIFKDQNTIRGLTTAAGLWVCAGLGLAIGVGMYEASIMSALIVYFSLSFFNRLEDSISHKDRMTINVKASYSENLISSLEEKLKSVRAEIVSLSVENREYNNENKIENIEIEIKVKIDSKNDIEKINKLISEIKGIHSISYEKIR